MISSYFVAVLLLAGIGGCTVSKLKIKQKQGTIVSVNGVVSKGKLGITLPHEHVLVDFIGADQVSPDRYNSDEVFVKVLPFLRKIKQQGCQTLVECTPAYLGRDVLLLQRLSKASGLTILTNTGYYGARQGKFLPAHAFTETAEQLATRWIVEAEQGIDNTPIKPGFLKISVDEGPLSVVNQKLVQAAALTHLKTGLTIASHTGNGEAALDQLALLQQHGVAGKAFVWVHAQNEKNTQWHQKAAKAGAWLEFDGISENNTGEYVQVLQNMKAAGLLNQVLISQDAGWYHVGEKQGGAFQDYETLFSTFIPALKKAGFTQIEIKQLLVINPEQAFSTSVKK
ncbi:phosphotriesterase family protein [Adhaeribacter pallidiroseus]|uniref:Aryldialkylphosphatase n=1 Tax=Adhaeribacter pallidiroseus TaxID=2072847 RepID=A0A369QBR1_9BACT|nr:phosphotriesterase [Adhaeribacter pallidiroseus]RDC61780.1 Aryldialkylphosphatase [Adhaeribacter pallidiroseus]